MNLILKVIDRSTTISTTTTFITRPMPTAFHPASSNRHNSGLITMNILFSLTRVWMALEMVGPFFVFVHSATHRFDEFQSRVVLSYLPLFLLLSASVVGTSSVFSQTAFQRYRIVSLICFRIALHIVSHPYLPITLFNSFFLLHYYASSKILSLSLAYHINLLHA